MSLGSPEGQSGWPSQFAVASQLESRALRLGRVGRERGRERRRGGREREEGEREEGGRENIKRRRDEMVICTLYRRKHYSKDNRTRIVNIQAHFV